MKPAWLLIAIFASVLAGAGGGYVATQMTAETPTASKVTFAAADLGNDDDTAAVDLQAQDKKIAALQRDLDSLMVRLAKAETASAENAKLKDDIKDLETKIADLKKAGPLVVSKDADGNPIPATTGALIPGTPEFDSAVAEAMEKKDAEDRAARDAEREKQMAEWATAQNKRIVDKLSESLSLTEVQKTNITAVLEDMNTKRSDIMKRGQEVRKNGEDFDWRGEMTAANNAAVEAVKSELSTAQITTFTELLGDSNSLDALGGGWGGRSRSQGGGGNRNQGSGN